MRTKGKHSQPSSNKHIFIIVAVVVVMLIACLAIFSIHHRSNTQTTESVHTSQKISSRSSHKRRESNSNDTTISSEHSMQSDGSSVDSQTETEQSTASTSSSGSSSYPTGNDVASGYVPGEGTKFAYNVARAGGLITGPHSYEQEDEFYQNSTMTDNSVTYNGQTVNYEKVYRPDGSYYYQVTPAN